jgi:hypothetical protein
VFAIVDYERRLGPKFYFSGKYTFACIHRSNTTIHPIKILLISLFENLPLLFLSAPDLITILSAPDLITMSSTVVSVFQTVLPVNAMSIDLIERLELPSDNLYPEDHLVTVPE